MTAAPRRGMSARDVFQALSYLQYPLLLIALGYVTLGAIGLGSGRGGLHSLDAWNYGLLYAGIAIGLSSMQDPRRTQNALSRRVWQHPGKGRWMLALLAVYAFYAFGAMGGGLAGAYFSASTPMHQLSLGLLALGLGLLGLLKTAMEMREHHRLDRNPQPGVAS